ncbi:MAG: hypothetical protein GEU93_06440 [Propionibacteriales bacterium]|nr:hypothetical protein [Propionibacteriales bacterium]
MTEPAAAAFAPFEGGPMWFPDSVTIREVAPRDGLQSLGRQIDTDDKIRMVDQLSDAGFRSIEFTGLAHPRAIPELADAEAVAAGISRRPGVEYRALVPSEKGAERALEAGADTLVALLTVSESYSRKNQNRTVDQLIDEVGRVFRLGRDAGVGVDVAVGIAFFCPYEGLVPEERAESVVDGSWKSTARRPCTLRRPSGWRPLVMCIHSAHACSGDGRTRTWRSTCTTRTAWRPRTSWPRCRLASTPSRAPSAGSEAASPCPNSSAQWATSLRRISCTCSRSVGSTAGSTLPGSPIPPGLSETSLGCALRATSPGAAARIRYWPIREGSRATARSHGARSLPSE